MTMRRARRPNNKASADLFAAILKAATDAGDGDLSAYLKKQATETPSAFLSLLGKVLPTQLTGDGGGPVELDLSGLTDEELDVLERVTFRRIAAAGETPTEH